MVDLDYRCHRFADRVGDRGQRYEVVGRRVGFGDLEVLGWSHESEGRDLLEAFRKWPRYSDVWIVDREAPGYDASKYRTAGELGAEPGEVES